MRLAGLVRRLKRWCEPIAETHVGMNERPGRERFRQLDSQAPDVNVDGSIARAKRLAPDGFVKLFTPDDPAVVACQFDK